jgi:uncharacterized membrane-anchored protein
MTTTTLPTSDAEVQFRKTAELVTQLQEALALTSVKQALSILSDEARPRNSLPDPVPGLHPDTNLAHYYHFLQGANAVLDRLKRLARRYDPRETMVEEPDEFDHIASDFQPLPLPKTDSK